MNNNAEKHQNILRQKTSSSGILLIFFQTVFVIAAIWIGYRSIALGKPLEGLEFALFIVTFLLILNTFRVNNKTNKIIQQANEHLLKANLYLKLSNLSLAAQQGSKGAAIELQVLKFNSGFEVGQLVYYFKTRKEGVFKGVIKSEASVIDGKAIVELEGIGDVPLSWISHIAD